MDALLLGHRALAPAHDGTRPLSLRKFGCVVVGVGGRGDPVLDAARRRGAIGPLAPEDPDPDWLARAATIDDLAAQVGLPAPGLARAVARFNGLAAAGRDEGFGRGALAWDRVGAGSAELAPIEEPPFCALRVLPDCLGTKGGLRIDDRGRGRHIEDAPRSRASTPRATRPRTRSAARTRARGDGRPGARLRLARRRDGCGVEAVRR